MKELRKYNDEINLDEVLDIIKYRIIKDTTNATTLLILWYLYATKKKQCEYEHVDKKTNKKAVYNSVVDIVADYGIDKDKWNVFVENMNVLYSNMSIIKSLTVDGLTPFIKMLESSYCFAINSIGIEADNKSIGFLYGYIIKASDISIRQVVDIKPALEINSVASYSVLYLSILKMIDNNAFLDQDEFPAITAEEKVDPKKEVEDIVKNSTTVSTPVPEKPVVIEAKKEEVKHKSSPADNFSKSRYQEVDKKEIDFLDEKVSYKSRFAKVKGQEIDILKIYNGIISNTTNIAELAKKYNVTNQTIRNPINAFCEENNLPRPRQGAKANTGRIIKPIPSRKKRVITNDDIKPTTLSNDIDESLFQRAQIQNAREITKINNSKSFFPSKIEGLKEEITGVTEQKRKFVNHPVDKERGVELFLNKEQKDQIKKSGECWMVLNTGKPYYVTADGRIWRNKPSEEDLKQYV